MNIHEFFVMGSIGEGMVLSNVVLALPCFDRILKHHKDNQKLAIQEIKYILWKYTWNSPYHAIPESNRERRLRIDMFNDTNHELSQVAKESAKCYVEEFQTNEVLEMLYGARDGITFITNEFRKAKNGESEMKVKEAVEAVIKMGGTMASLELMIKAAKKRESNSDEFDIRGGGKLGIYEE